MQINPLWDEYRSSSSSSSYTHAKKYVRAWISGPDYQGLSGIFTIFGVCSSILVFYWLFLLVKGNRASGGCPTFCCSTVVQAHLKPLGKWSVNTQWQRTELKTNRQTLGIVLRDRAVFQHWSCNDLIQSHAKTGSFRCKGIEVWKSTRCEEPSLN